MRAEIGDRRLNSHHVWYDGGVSGDEQAKSWSRKASAIESTRVTAT